VPTYQYQCTGCGHELEEFQSIKAEPLKSCPACSQDLLRRKVGGGAATLRFTGSGFYITDYARKDGQCGCGKEKESCGD